MNNQNPSSEPQLTEAISVSAPQAPSVPARAYEAPAVESVVTFDSLAREVLYAGNSLSSVNDTGPTDPPGPF